jgi:hypothetical protein
VHFFKYKDNGKGTGTGTGKGKGKGKGKTSLRSLSVQFVILLVFFCQMGDAFDNIEPRPTQKDQQER